MRRSHTRRVFTVLCAVLATALTTSTAVARADVGTRATATAASGDVGWNGFGNTPDENRHSPLTQIDEGNVSTLGRAFTADFWQIDPTVRLGEQSYPVVQNGTMYV